MAGINNIQGVYNSNIKRSYDKLTFEVGEKFSGKIMTVGETKDEVMVKLPDGWKFPAKLDAPLDSLPQGLVKFEVEGFEDGKLKIKFLTEELSQENNKDNIEEFLTKTNLNISKKDYNLLESMIKHNIPLTKDNITYIKTILDFKNKFQDKESVDNFIKAYLNSKGINLDSPEAEKVSKILKNFISAVKDVEVGDILTLYENNIDITEDNIKSFVNVFKKSEMFNEIINLKSQVENLKEEFSNSDINYSKDSIDEFGDKILKFQKEINNGLNKEFIGNDNNEILKIPSKEAEGIKSQLDNIQMKNNGENLNNQQNNSVDLENSSSAVNLKDTINAELEGNDEVSLKSNDKANLQGNDEVNLKSNDKANLQSDDQVNFKSNSESNLENKEYVNEKNNIKIGISDNEQANVKVNIKSDLGEGNESSIKTNDGFNVENNGEVNLKNSVKSDTELTGQMNLKDIDNESSNSKSSVPNNNKLYNEGGNENNKLETVQYKQDNKIFKGNVNDENIVLDKKIYNIIKKEIDIKTGEVKNIIKNIMNEMSKHQGKNYERISQIIQNNINDFKVFNSISNEYYYLDLPININKYDYDCKLIIKDERNQGKKIDTKHVKIATSIKTINIGVVDALIKVDNNIMDIEIKCEENWIKLIEKNKDKLMEMLINNPYNVYIKVSEKKEEFNLSNCREFFQDTNLNKVDIKV